MNHASHLCNGMLRLSFTPSSSSIQSSYYIWLWCCAATSDRYRIEVPYLLFRPDIVNCTLCNSVLKVDLHAHLFYSILFTTVPSLKTFIHFSQLSLFVFVSICSVTKLSIVGSILVIMVQKGILQLFTSEVLLCIACIGSLLQVIMYLSSASDPFVYLEKAVAAVLFREPKEKANTSDAKKKRE